MDPPPVRCLVVSSPCWSFRSEISCLSFIKYGSDLRILARRRRFVYRNAPNCCIMLGWMCSTIFHGIFPYSCPLLRSTRIVIPTLIIVICQTPHTIALLINFCAASISPCDRTQFRLLGRTNRNIVITDTSADTCK